MDEEQLSADGVSTDTVFELLSHHRRRACLQCLQTHGSPLPLADIAEEVASREHNAAITEISAVEVKQIYMSLYHAHIPKLADYDIVAYDQETDTVALAANAKPVLAFAND